MKRPSDSLLDSWKDLQRKIIGLGERSIRKSYYPELQKRLDELERFKALLDHSQDAIFLVEVPSGRLVDCNESARRLLGTEQVNIFETSLFQRLDRSASARIRKAFSRSGRASLRWRFLTAAFLQSDDRRIPVEIALSFVQFGETRYGVAVARDITERVRAESALRESEERFRQLAENIDEVFWISSPDRTEIEYLSPAFDRIWGRPRDSVLRGPSSWLRTVHPDDLPGTVETIKTRAMEGYDLTYRIVRPDGSVRWIRDRAFPIRDGRGRTLRLCGVAEDITARREAEETARLQEQKLIQADKMASMGMLVSGVAHEINNPNNFILLNAGIVARVWRELLPALDDYRARHGEFVLAGMPYEEAREKMGRLVTGIVQGAQRIQKIVQSLTDFARQDPGQRNECVSMKAVVESAASLLDPLIRKSAARFSLTVEPALPPVRGSFQQLEQVVVNLMTNACQALTGKDQGIEVSVRYLSEDRAVVTEVVDEGEGIRPEDLPRIFDPFFTTKRSSGGTGLGLSVSFRIVRDHGGTLRYVSRPGCGTRAILTLPAAETNLQAQEAAGS